MKRVAIQYFSDVLCVWAYVAEARVRYLKSVHGDDVVFQNRFCSVFGDTHRKIPLAWRDKGGFQGFNAHVREVIAGFPDLQINPSLWLDVRPASSMGVHLFLKAGQLAERSGALAPDASDRLLWAIRSAFFVDGRDIATLAMQRDVAVSLGLELGPIDEALANGTAFAALAHDYQDAEAMKVQGSPTFVLNEGRQKLYGNVGALIIEANIAELLREPNPDQASWC